MDLGLAGLRAVVTGGTRGIGRAVAELLAREGCAVAVCARGPERLGETLGAVEAHGVPAWGRTLQARDGAAVRGFVAEAAERLGGLDILIANVSAGGGMDSERNWYRNFEIDLMGAVRATEAAMPALRRSGKGAVVMVGTMAAAEVFHKPMAYNAMKAALTAHAGALARPAMARGVRVNAVAPGPTRFPGSAWEMVEIANRRLYRSVVSRQPLRRLAHPEEIAGPIVFLASPAASWVAGDTLPIDGGYTARVPF